MVNNFVEYLFLRVKPTHETGGRKYFIPVTLESVSQRKIRSRKNDQDNKQCPSQCTKFQQIPS